MSGRMTPLNDAMAVATALNVLKGEDMASQSQPCGAPKSAATDAAASAAEKVAELIGQCADIKVTYDSIGRQYTHIANADELAEAVLRLVARHMAFTEVPPVKHPAPVWPKKGDRMRFMNRNGYDGERAQAAAVFGEGRELTVTRCEVGSWSHSLWFEEDPRRGWNGVMFEFVGRPERYPLPAPADAGREADVTATGSGDAPGNTPNDFPNEITEAEA